MSSLVPRPTSVNGLPLTGADVLEVLALDRIDELAADVVAVAGTVVREGAGLAGGRVGSGHVFFDDGHRDSFDGPRFGAAAVDPKVGREGLHPDAQRCRRLQGRVRPVGSTRGVRCGRRFRPVSATSPAASRAPVAGSRRPAAPSGISAYASSTSRLASDSIASRSARRTESRNSTTPGEADSGNTGPRYAVSATRCAPRSSSDSTSWASVSSGIGRRYGLDSGTSSGARRSSTLRSRTISGRRVSGETPGSVHELAEMLG